jgi:hypothetical protein
LKQSRRILLLTFYYEPDLCAGSFRATALMEAFKDVLSKDDRIDVITTMPNRYQTFKVDAQEYEQDGLINIYRIPLPTHQSGLTDQAKSFTKYFFRALAITRGKQYDLVIATSSRLFTAFLGSISSYRFRAPLYLDIRDIFIDTMNEVLTNRLLKAFIMPLLILVERFSFGRANHINLVSEGFKKYFKQRYQTKYSFFTNGIDQEFLDYDFSATFKNEKPIITYAGNIGEGQGLHIIIPEVAKALEKEFQFKIIGDGGAKPKLVEELNRLDVKNVDLIKPVNREGLKKYYKESDYLFLHLNAFKAFEKVLPSKIFEYAVTNKPIIGGVGGYAAKFLEKNVSNAIIFPPGDVDTFIEKMRNYENQSFDVNSFIEKYSRKNVMKNMVNGIQESFLE